MFLIVYCQIISNACFFESVSFADQMTRKLFKLSLTNQQGTETNNLFFKDNKII